MDIRLHIRLDAPKGGLRRVVLFVAVPLALVGVTAVIARATLTPDPSTWAISGQPILAAALSSNLVQLDKRLSTVETTYAPSGTIQAYGGEIDGNPGDPTDGEALAHPPPNGWLLCNGDPLNGIDTRYASLYAAIGTSYGGSTASQSFNLPDLRGYFLRGIDTTGARDPDALSRSAMNTGGNTGATVGTFEGEQVQSHNHSITDQQHSHGGTFLRCGAGDQQANQGTGATCTFGQQGVDSSYTGITSTNASNGSETRPENVAVNYIIKL